MKANYAQQPGYPYQAGSAYYYTAPQPLPVMQQPMYVAQPSSPVQNSMNQVMVQRSTPSPMMVQPVVMTQTPYGTQVTYNIAHAPATPPRANPVYVYNPQVVMPPAQQADFTVEETSAWLHELCMMRQWNNEAEAYKNLFLSRQICGSKMKRLNYEDLRVLGIKEQHREELLEAITQAFQEQNAFYNQQPSYSMPAMQMQPVCVRQPTRMSSPFVPYEGECMSSLSDCGVTTDDDHCMETEDESGMCPETGNVAGSQSPSPPSPSGFGRTRVQNLWYNNQMMEEVHSDSSMQAEEAAKSPAPLQPKTTEVVVPKKNKIMPRPKNPMQYRVLMTLKMKSGRSLQSSYVGHVNKDTVVWVNTVRGRRARIVEKTETGTKNLGWVSLRLENGKHLLVQEQMYQVNPEFYYVNGGDNTPMDGAQN